MAAFGVVTTDMMVLLAGFAASIVLCVIIIKTAPLHSHLSSDEDSGVQKIHKGIVPRIGGVGLWGGVLAAALMLYAQAHEASSLVGMIILGSLPVFAIGLVEDITKAVSPFAAFDCERLIRGYWLVHRISNWDSGNWLY